MMEATQKKCDLASIISIALMMEAVSSFEMTVTI
jgi:hypothetical protein